MSHRERKVSILFCTTTTPFAVEDIAVALSKPVEHVNITWKILQPFFGTQQVFGIGRVVAMPNFFDVIAMSVLMETLKLPQEIDNVVKFSVTVAEEVATFIDCADGEYLFSEQLRYAVFDHIMSNLEYQMTRGVNSFDILNCWTAISRVFDGVETEFNRSQSLHNPNFQQHKQGFRQSA